MHWATTQKCCTKSLGLKWENLGEVPTGIMDNHVYINIYTQTYSIKLHQFILFSVIILHGDHGNVTERFAWLITGRPAWQQMMFTYHIYTAEYRYKNMSFHPGQSIYIYKAYMCVYIPKYINACLTCAIRKWTGYCTWRLYWEGSVKINVIICISWPKVSTSSSKAIQKSSNQSP